jgi:hypothetical protein
MKFRDLACEHLAQYKIESLGIEEDGIFHYRGRKVPKGHILPYAQREKNILEQYRERYFASEHANITFHQYFHHLNSSQALCINLFYPLIAENRLDHFMAYLELPTGPKLLPVFEKDSDLEVAARRTSFDFYVKQGEARRVYVEVKYTEDGFGKAKNDDEHRKKFTNTYLPLVRQKSAFLIPECQECEVFLNHYQVLRNLVHVSEDDYVVLLFPRGNKKVLDEAIYARDNLLTDKGRERLKIVLLDDFVTFLEDECDGSNLDGYYRDFRRKYLPEC